MNSLMYKARAILYSLPLVAAALPLSAIADLTRQEPVTITVHLGDAKDQLRFEPETLRFETGKLYRLIITNPSPSKHYFSSAGLAGSVYTRKVQIDHPNGMTMVEVKGVVREIEVYPGYSTQWWFVPVKAGTWDDLRCTIPGHGAAGMVGQIIIH